MIEIILISKTEVIKDFLPTMQKVLKRNVAAGCDRARMPFNYLASLGDFSHVGLAPDNAYCQAGSLLRHIHVSFLVISHESYLQDIAMEGLLGVTLADSPPRGLDVAIMSGNLEAWRTTIINGCTERAIDTVREFCTKVLVAFDLLGYTKVFEQYSRNPLQDGTLLLKYRGQ